MSTVTENRAPTGYLTPQETADLLKVHLNTLVRWRRQGQGPKFQKLGDRRTSPIRYRAGDVHKWMQSHTSGGSAA